MSNFLDGNSYPSSQLYNATSQMKSKTKDGVTTTFTYDLAGQLASESRSGYSASYTFDANGNRLTKTLNGTTENYTYDDGDKMLTAGSKSYGYDAAGRTTSVTNGSNVTNLTYDYESRLSTLAGPGISSSYSYNGLDTRVSKIENSVSNTFVRDGIGVTAPVIRDTDATYTPGVSERRGSVSTFNFSGLKNSELQTSAIGATTSTKIHDAYGAVVSSTGTWSGPFGYAGDFGYQEDASGLKLLGHRYYDSSTGRFLTRDVAKDGRNWYIYAASEPNTHCDPDGKAVVVVALVAVGVIGFVGILLFGRKHLGRPDSDDSATFNDQREKKLGGWAKAYETFEKEENDYKPPAIEPSDEQSQRIKKGIEATADAYEDAVEEAFIEPGGGPFWEIAMTIALGIRDFLKQFQVPSINLDPNAPN